MPDDRSYLVGHDGGQRKQSDRQRDTQRNASQVVQWQEVIRRDHQDRGCRGSEQSDGDEPSAIFPVDQNGRERRLGPRQGLDLGSSEPGVADRWTTERLDGAPALACRLDGRSRHCSRPVGCAARPV